MNKGANKKRLISQPLLFLIGLYTLKFYLIKLAPLRIERNRVPVVGDGDVLAAAGNGNAAADDTAGIAAK